MGLSSSLLDENKSNFIKSWVQTELRHFASIYKKQHSLAFLSRVHDELVQRKQEHTQLLKQRDLPQEAEVVYQETVLYFCLNRKWKKRFVVVRANYSLECHESSEAFMKGIPPLNTLPTTGGTVLTTQEKYMEIVDQCFPDTDHVKEDFAPPVAGMPGQFPVYLRLPYQRDYYFCFLQETNQATFCSVLSDCIRHQNQDFLKNQAYEVQAFIKAVQLYRQEKGYYEGWDMLIGNDVQVLANLTMEELMPVLENDLLARLQAKKMDKKRLWFTTVETVYNLLQETLKEGMAALDDECRDATMHQSALMRSDLDQIISSRAFLESKLRATVAELATEYCKQHVEPRLPAVLEEMMGPISLGFAEARQVSESMMEHLCEKYQAGLTRGQLQQALVEMSKPNLQNCYEKVSGLRDHIREFSYPNCRGLEHSTQIDIQQLVDSASYTFGLLLTKSSQDDTNLLDAMMKAKQRVLKQYDYDSSTLRKKIFQEALLSIALPSVKAFLAPTFKKELTDFQQYIFDDYVNFINVENVYEDILQEILKQDISKVVKEAASMKKYDLHMESRYRFSVSGKYVTPPDSPDYTSSFTTPGSALPSSPLLSPSLTENQCTDEDPGKAEKTLEQEVFIDQQVADQELAQAELIKVCPSEHTIEEQEVTMAQQDDVQAQAQPELIGGPEGEDLVSAENKVNPEVIIQAHEQPNLIKVPTGKDPGMAEKKVEVEVIVQAQAQPALIRMSPGQDPNVAEKKMAEEVIIQAQVQPKLSKVPAVEYPSMAKKKVEQKVEVPVHAQSELIKGCPSEDTIREQEVTMAQQDDVQAQAQPELIGGLEGEDLVSTENKVNPEVIIQAHEQPNLIKVPTDKDPGMAEKKVELEVIVQAQAQPALIRMSPGQDPNVAEKKMAEEVIIQAQVQPKLSKVPAVEYPSMAKKKVEQKVEVQVHAQSQSELIKGCPGENTKVVEQELTTSVKVKGEHKVEDNAAQSVPFTVHPALVEKTFVAIQSLEEKTHSGSPNVTAINTETLLDMSSSSNTEPAAHIQTEPNLKPLDTAVQGSPIASPTPLVQVSPPAKASHLVQTAVKASPLVSASPPAHSSPPEGDTGSISPNLKFVSSDSEVESAAKIRNCSAKESTPNIQPQVMEEQTSNTTGDTSVAVNDLISLRPLIYEVRVSNGTQDFSDDSSWTTEEEGDSIEEDDPTMETTAAAPIPEECVIVRGNTILDTSANATQNAMDPKTKADRPLDCIREIRELVVEVIEVEEVPQHYPDDGEHCAHP